MGGINVLYFTKRLNKAGSMSLKSYVSFFSKEFNELPVLEIRHQMLYVTVPLHLRHILVSKRDAPVTSYLKRLASYLTG